MDGYPWIIKAIIYDAIDDFDNFHNNFGDAHGKSWDYNGKLRMLTIYILFNTTCTCLPDHADLR